MEELLTALLLADADLRQLVGDAIDWGRLREGAALGVVLNRVSSRRDYTNDGRSPLTGHRVQIDAWARTSAEAGAIKDALLAIVAPVRIGALRILLNDDPPDYWTPASGPDADRYTDRFRASLDAQVWHLETATS